MAEDLTIKPLSTHAELRECENIQRLTWNMIDSDVVPMHLLVAFVLHGGIVLGAFVGKTLVGFLFGYPGLLPETDPRSVWMGTRFFHASQMLGVLPEYQDRGIGYELKKEQRRIALSQGFRLVTWTFDPLLSRNAHFNMTRLGGISRTYIRNIYDELPGINAGLPTDRFEVEWWIASEHVLRRMQGLSQPDAQAWLHGEIPIVNPSVVRPDGLRAPAANFDLPDLPRILVEIPGEFAAIKSADMGLAQAWRFHIRELMEAAFQAGYSVTWFASQIEGGTRRSTYVLTREFDVAAIARQSFLAEPEEAYDEY